MWRTRCDPCPSTGACVPGVLQVDAAVHQALLEATGGAAAGTSPFAAEAGEGDVLGSPAAPIDFDHFLGMLRSPSNAEDLELFEDRQVCLSSLFVGFGTALQGLATCSGGGGRGGGTPTFTHDVGLLSSMLPGGACRLSNHSSRLPSMWADDLPGVRQQQSRKQLSHKQQSLQQRSQQQPPQGASASPSCCTIN